MPKLSTHTSPFQEVSGNVGEPVDGNGFWREAIALHGSVTLRVMPHVIAFGVLATLIEVLVLSAEAHFGIRLALPVAPYEIAGALVGLLLVLRNNSGYERWWEGRKLWGGL